MKKVLAIILFLSIVSGAKSQNLTVEGTAPNLYIIHTVAPKENFYSVGRLYNQNAKAIASFNNVAMEKGLTIGQHIKIPLNAQNLDLSGNPIPGETLIPLTHVVAKSETLSKIGSDNNVSSQAIKQWNNLSSDNIAPGTPIVVGHLKMSSTAGVAKTSAGATTQPVAKQQEVAEPKPVAAEPKAAEPKKEETVVAAGQPPVADKQEATTAVPQERAKQTETVATAVKEVPAKEAPAKQTVEAPANEITPKPTEATRSQTYSYSTANNMGSIEGVFANVFPTDAAQKSLSTKSGEAATFKSTSGWQDKKYYVLMNDVASGTIVKIASVENKVVYAKVLGSMPDMKENNGLLLRMSNAAASYLGIIDPKFGVQISYYQ